MESGTRIRSAALGHAWVIKLARLRMYRDVITVNGLGRRVRQCRLVHAVIGCVRVRGAKVGLRCWLEFSSSVWSAVGASRGCIFRIGENESRAASRLWGSGGSGGVRVGVGVDVDVDVGVLVGDSYGGGGEAGSELGGEVVGDV